VHERDIRRYPPQDPENLLGALREVRKLQGRVKAIADKLPRPFQLDGVNDDMYVPFVILDGILMTE
jgi:hypothetical protein